MKPKAKTAEPLPGVLRQDQVFFHLAGTPTSGSVLSSGKHGITVDHGGTRRKVRWVDVLGYKKRSVPAMRVVDHGDDGAILEDERGKRIYAHGWEEPDQRQPGANNTQVPMAERPRADDPMRKAIVLFGEVAVFAKRFEGRILVLPRLVPR